MSEVYNDMEKIQQKIDKALDLLENIDDNIGISMEMATSLFQIAHQMEKQTKLLEQIFSLNTEQLQMNREFLYLRKIELITHYPELTNIIESLEK